MGSGIISGSSADNMWLIIKFLVNFTGVYLLFADNTGNLQCCELL